MKNRVVITGLGVVAPNGVGVSEFTQALKNGKSGIDISSRIKGFKLSLVRLVVFQIFQKT